MNSTIKQNISRNSVGMKKDAGIQNFGQKIHLDNFLGKQQDSSFIKKQVNENLTRSGGCKFVTGDYENTGKFGECYKVGCLHAHTLSEWVPARCNFKDNCHNQRCNFFHPNTESIVDWLERTNSQPPNLPEQTQTLKKLKNKNTSLQFVPSQVNMDKILTPPLQNVIFEEVFEDFEKQETLPNLTNLTPIIRCSTQELLMFAIQQCVSRGKFNLDAQISDYSKKNNPTTYTVTVPTENIAKFTIESFFNKGQFDIDIRLSE
jgi:hypothetical protein